MMNEFARIVQGVTMRNRRILVRGFTIGVGILAVIISGIILASPNLVLSLLP
jgi:hypothetical protein